MNNYELTISEYFSLVQEKIKSKDFKILKINSLPKEEISVFLESVNYMMWEWSDDHKDEREYFDYIIIPNETDWDFTSIQLNEFLTFLSNNKSKEILNVDIKNIEIVSEIEEKDELDDFWSSNEYLN